MFQAANAQYRVSLEDDEPIKGVDWSKAFSIIPTQGYQRGEFKLVILDAPQLDFEVPEWQNIKLKVKSTSKLREKLFYGFLVLDYCDGIRRPCSYWNRKARN